MYDINQVEYGQHVGYKCTSINIIIIIYQDIINYWATPSYVPMSNTASHDTMRKAVDGFLLSMGLCLAAL